MSKSEATQVISYLSGLGTEHSKLQTLLFKDSRAARTIDSEVIRNRIPSAELRTYFSYHKGCLQEHILSVLFELDSDDHVVFRDNIMDALGKATVLYDKGFEENAVKAIDKLLLKVDSQFDADLRLLILNEQYRLLKKIPLLKRPAMLESVGGERKAVIHILTNEGEYDELSEKIHFLYLSARQSSAPEYTNQLSLLFQNPLLKSETRALSFKARLNFYMCHVFKHSLLGETTKQVAVQHQIVSLWNQYPDFRERRPFMYQYSLVNLLNGYCKAGNDQKFDVVYKEAMSIKGLNKKESAAGYIALISCKLYFLLNMASIDKVIAFAKRIGAELPTKAKYAIPGTIINLQYNLASVLFVSGEFEESERALRVITDSKSDLRFDIQGTARILLKLSCFGRKDSEYIHSLNMASRRFFRSHKMVDKMQGITFRLVDKLLNHPESEHPSALQFELENLKELQNNNPTHLGIEEVIMWVESIFQGVPIRKIWESKRTVKVA
ncbi:MAG: hypothetical protein K9G46_15555 [Flavobacteriales bacterium]|nr:hypothetical protein [Flavobacteriales bacterium]